MLRFILDRFRRAREPLHLQTGKWGEAVAERHLLAKGYKVLGRRVRIGRRAEVDLLMQNESALVFVEVKTRGTLRFGSGMTYAKRRMISHAAVRYVQRMRQKPPHVRFDVVMVTGQEAMGLPEIRHIENAFPLTDNLRMPT